MQINHESDVYSCANPQCGRFSVRSPGGRPSVSGWVVSIRRVCACLCSQPHRRRIEPPVCSPLQSHQCNQTSATINHRLWTPCPARCHAHPHKHTPTRHVASTRMQKNGRKCGVMNKDRYMCGSGNKAWKCTQQLKWGATSWVVALHKANCRPKDLSFPLLGQKGCLLAQGGILIMLLMLPPS